MVEKVKDKVLITGVTGYIASQVKPYFLKDEGYDIRGTVRDPSNAENDTSKKSKWGRKFCKNSIHKG
jgi:uncharacterized protein YbjT (DUF2867 family)